MKLRVLGSAGAEFPDFRPPAFLIDERLLLDAGTIGAVLAEDEQWNIGSILITHAHLDHIRALPALADNIIIKNIEHTVQVYSVQPVISALCDHLFNGLIWPDFTRLPDECKPVISLNPICVNQEYVIDGYAVKGVAVNHTVPTVGYLVEKNGTRLAYTGDTGPTEEFWHHASGADALIVEVSFPDCMESMALLTRHLTSSLLRKELDKMGTLPRRILITHPKPQYYDTIRREVDSLGMQEIILLHDGDEFEL